MWVGEMTQEDVIANYLKISQWQNNNDSLNMWLIILTIFLLFISYWIGRKFVKR